MAFLLDTNVLSELRNPKKANPDVLSWAQKHSMEQHFISVLSIGEIRKGIELLRRRAPDQCPAFETWLDAIRSNYRDNIIPLSESIMEEWGSLMARKMLPALDSLIAATALNLNLTLVTRNEKDFQGVGLAMVNPFSS